MSRGELNRLIDNLDDTLIEIMAAVALRIAGIASEKFTGSVAITLNAHLGGVGDVHVQKTEVFRLSKKRGVRSAGV